MPISRRPKPDHDTAWVACRHADLVVGDAIRFTILARREGRVGEIARVQTENGAHVIRERVQIVGRVVGLASGDLEGELMFERTAVAGEPHRDAILPATVGIAWEAALDARHAHLHRRRDQGPAERTHEAGRTYLASLLGAAAGGDHNCADAVARVAECVSPVDLDRAERNGVYPPRLGTERARALLAGETMFEESVVRQLDGRVKIGQTEAPRNEVVPVKAISASAPQPQDTTSDETDTEVARVLSFFPGARLITHDEAKRRVVDSLPNQMHT